MAVSALTRLLPRRTVPELAVPLVGGGRWRLADWHPERFTLVVFYRAVHCPIFAGYLRELESKLEKFARRDVAAVAISSDDATRAATAKERWRLPSSPLGSGLVPPHFADILSALDFVITKNYPARGEVTDLAERPDAA